MPSSRGSTRSITITSKTVAAGFQESAGILVAKCDTGIIEAALVMIGQVGPAEFDDLSVKVDHGGSFHGTVGQHLAQGTSLPASANKHGPGLGMTQHCRMHQGLVVNELVRFGRLCFTVQYQSPAEDIRIQYLHLLIGGITRKQYRPQP